MRIVLDAMGSDTCPVPDVDGAVQAARQTGDTIILACCLANVGIRTEAHTTKLDKRESAVVLTGTLLYEKYRAT